MANGQYTIPESLRASEPEVFSDQPVEAIEVQQTADVAPQPEIQSYAPELQPSNFTLVSQIKARLDSYRDTAITIEESKHKWLKSMKALVLTPKPISAELTEKESIIGGRIFQKPDSKLDVRFWEKDGGWFYGYTDGKNIKLEDTTIHYEFGPNGVEKLYQGRSVPFVPGEEAHLILAIQTFEHNVVHELYPIDDVLQELKKDDLGLAA
jgi:hypothetical protein